jgi:hypothetical protein
MERGDELELLQSMFPEELQPSDGGDPYAFTLALTLPAEDGGEPDVPFELVCQLPPEYPAAVGAELALRCGRCDRAGLSALRAALLESLPEEGEGGQVFHAATWLA